MPLQATGHPGLKNSLQMNPPELIKKHVQIRK